MVTIAVKRKNEDVVDGFSKEAEAEGFKTLVYEDVYPAGAATRVNVSGLSDELCGQHRPGHFEGVATVVAALFNMVLPDFAVFGRKDFQQLQIVRRMVADLHFPVRIVAADHLAMKWNYATCEELAKKYTKNASFITIGPAGEQLLTGASVACTDQDSRHPGPTSYPGPGRADLTGGLFVNRPDGRSSGGRRVHPSAVFRSSTVMARP